MKAPRDLNLSGFVVRADFALTAALTFRIDDIPYETSFLDVPKSALVDSDPVYFPFEFRKTRKVKAGQSFDLEVKFLRSMTVVQDATLAIGMLETNEPRNDA